MTIKDIKEALGAKHMQRGVAGQRSACRLWLRYDE